MAADRKPLTDARLKQLDRMPEPGKIADGVVPGLYVECTKAGNLLWRLKYRMAGKENRAALGAYPDVGLAEARRRAQEARTLIASGVAPVEHKRAQQAAQEATAAQTFEAVAKQWLESRKGKLTDKVWRKYGRVMAHYAYPAVGKSPVTDLRLADMLRTVTLVGDRPAMARLVMRLCEATLDYAEAHGLIDRNVLAGRKQSKSDALPDHQVRNMASMRDPAQVGGFLRALDAYRSRGNSSVLSALRLLTMAPARPAEICAMRWQDVDLDAGTWTFTMSKVDRPHVVYLPAQAVELLRGLQAEGTGSAYVFPSPAGRQRHIARNALLAAIRRIGFTEDEATAHGWRSTFRTLGAEVLEIEPDVLELALGHKLADPHKGAYNRVTLEQKRRAAAQRWADYLDELKAQVPA